MGKRRIENIHKIETSKDAKDYISRLAGVQTVMQQIVEQLRQGESLGVIPPKMVYPKVLPGAQNMLKGAPFEEIAEDGVLLADFRGKVESLGLDSEDTDILLNEAANALSGPFRNGYQALIAELLRLQAIKTDKCLFGSLSLDKLNAYKSFSSCVRIGMRSYKGLSQ